MRRASLAVAAASLNLIASAPFALARDLPAPRAPFVAQDAAGRLVYSDAASGDRIADFSHAGYGGGGVALPSPPATLLVSPVKGDATEIIQTALDLAASAPADRHGLRGVVLLAPGTFRIAGQLTIRASGVILRGSGSGPGGSLLSASGASRRTLVDIRGTGTLEEDASSRRRILGGRVAVGATRLQVERADGLRVGDAIVVRRPSTAAWIETLGMNAFPGWRPENRLHWTAGSRDIVWERRIVGVEGAFIRLEAPITTALDPADGAYVASYTFPGRVRNVGVENLAMMSEVDPKRPKDEDHSWFALAIDRAEDVWVRDLRARQFASYAVNIGPQARRVTVQDVSAEDPVSEIGGYRRRIFYTAGQQTLFNRCRSRRGAHDLLVGHAAAGPNVFLECVTEQSSNESGALESWSSGTLFDGVIIRGNQLRLVNRGSEEQGAGWAAANSIIWNCEATDVEVQNPPGAWNLAAGCKGTSSGDGIFIDPRAVPFRDFHRAQSHLPESLYRAQLEERLGTAALGVLDRAPLSVDTGGARVVTPADVQARRRVLETRREAASPPLRIEGGRFMIGETPAWTARTSFSWFQGQMPPSRAASFGPAITRFAPGREGRGQTDRLEEVVDEIPPGGAFYHHYGLWYDRRRVNHNYDGSAERRTGDVWGPLLEQPWRRSGDGKAWDGLSRYDLTQFNPWFFDRVADFARLADRRGRILYYNFYFQHNLLESRSHYVDFPWRPANAIQATGMPDEVPAANAFYDLRSAVRRSLHERYINHSLDRLKGRSNVVLGIDTEYTGAEDFVHFWLDTIARWARRNRSRPFTALEIPKAQTDAILADPRRARLIDAIDFHHWTYRPDGSLFSIEGGVNKAPREQREAIIREQDIAQLRASAPDLPSDLAALRATQPYQAMRERLWKTTAAMRYRAWREYRDRYPALVLLTTYNEFPGLTRALEEALPSSARAGLAPVPALADQADTAWATKDESSGRLLVYSVAGAQPVLQPGVASGPYEIVWIADGKLTRARTDSPSGRLQPPAGFDGMAWAAFFQPVLERR